MVNICLDELNKPFLQVAADDKDRGELGKLFYSLEENQDTIKVDNLTGGISLLKKLDYEERKALR